MSFRAWVREQLDDLSTRLINSYRDSEGIHKEIESLREDVRKLRREQAERLIKHEDWKPNETVRMRSFLWDGHPARLLNESDCGWYVLPVGFNEPQFVYNSELYKPDKKEKE